MQCLNLCLQSLDFLVQILLLVQKAFHELVFFDVAASVGVDLSENVVDDSGDVIFGRFFQPKPVGELLPRDLPAVVSVDGAELLVQSPLCIWVNYSGLVSCHLFK